MRLDKAIASQGSQSRKEVRGLIKAGRVSVDGETVRDPGTNVEPAAQTILVDGSTLGFQEHVYLMLNKPKGVVSATEDPVHKTVLDLVPEELFRPGLFPAGRLDADTTGFVLLTDDGAFAHDILSPKHHVQKTYRVTLKDPVTEEQLERVRQGIELKDGTVCLPANVASLDSHSVSLQIVEGKYHQVKRMFAAAGNHVTDLQRTAIGALSIDEALLPGECREITGEELKKVSFRSKSEET